MSQLFDDLARTLARPLPRRGVLRLLGGALVAAAVPGIATTKARAASSFHTCARDGGILCECNCKGEACQRICCTPKEEFECDCGPVEVGAGCKKKPCRVPCPQGSKCCKDDEFCANSAQQLCCKVGERGCGPVCCKPNEECRTARFGTGSQKICTKRCPQGQAWCGRDKCCPPKWHCANEATGLCKRCRKNEEECGSKCCDRKTSRCCGKAGCCPKGRSCCVNDNKQVCCPPRHGCAVPILPGNVGVVPKTEAICCPNERLSQSPKLCCPPGQVPLNTPGFRIPPPGVSPFCCPRGQICSSSSGRVCVDFQSDAQNCGSCGNVCASGECLRGVCVLP